MCQALYLQHLFSLTPHNRPMSRLPYYSPFQDDESVAQIGRIICSRITQRANSSILTYIKVPNNSTELQ